MEEKLLDFLATYPSTPRGQARSTAQNLVANANQKKRQVFCAFCPSERLAVSVCSGEEHPRFRGCNQPFCEQHSFVAHEVAAIAGVPSLAVEAMSKARSNLLERLHARGAQHEARCCRQCMDQFLGVLEKESQQSHIRKRILSVALLLLILILCCSITWTYFKKLTLLEDSFKCDPGFFYDLGTCIRFASTLDTKLWFKYKFQVNTGRACGQSFSSRGCICPLYMQFDQETTKCIRPKCDPSKEAISPNGQCFSITSMPQNSSDRCPYDTKYRENIGFCLMTLCPLHYLTLANSFCMVKPLYRDQTQFYPPYHTFGQLVCPNTTYLKKYRGPEYVEPEEFVDWTMKPLMERHQEHTEEIYESSSAFETVEMQVCEPQDMLMSKILGCSMDCSPFETYDFFLKECRSPAWCNQPGLFVSEEGECEACGVWTAQWCGGECCFDPRRTNDEPPGQIP